MTTTLLGADDSVTMRKVLEITFGGENYKTVLAASAQEALNLAKSEKPAIALVDHTLPDMSGYDLARDLKAAVPGIAVVVLSSKQAPYDKARGAASGVDDFMDKPFDTQKMLDKVTAVLGQPRAAAAPAAAPPVPAPAPAPAPAAKPAAPAPVAAPAAPLAAAPMAAAGRPRSQTLAYGSTVPVQPGGTPPQPAVSPAVASPARPIPSPAATPKPPVVHAPPAAPAAKPAPQPAPQPAAAPATSIAAAVAAAGASAGNGQLSGKLEALGLTPAQVESVLALSREVVEQVVWEVVPVLAETIIKEEIRRLTSG